MANTKKSASTDDNKPQKPLKKGRDIKPLHEKQLKKQMQADAELQQANADVLAELARKAAELADTVQGVETPKQKVLKLDEPEGAEPKDIFAALDAEENIEVPPIGVEAHVKPVDADANPAAQVIREKLNRLYKNEPDAATEAAEAVAITKHRSKHQQFMYDLTTSGKSLAEIQTQWHEYYVALPNDDKHEVWQEFYSNQHAVSSYAKHQSDTKKPTTEKAEKKVKHSPQLAKNQSSDADNRSVKDIKTGIMHKVNAGGRLKPIHHFKSALFGIGLAGVVGLAFTFVFFNEVFIAPFISPSRTVSATPIIGDVNGPVSPEPKIIIPKINLEVPVVYDLGTTAEDSIQDALEDGVVHYAASPEPGEQGNSVIVGHSSNNILNSGKYKFAFVLLKRLEIDDTFFVHKDGVRYTYKIYDKKVVPPTNVSVLGPADRDNTITLITCDPPGTSINRLIIVAEQITPDPAGNTQADINIDAVTEELPSNAPSLWSRINPFD